MKYPQKYHTRYKIQDVRIQDVIGDVIRIFPEKGYPWFGNGF